MCPSTDPLVFDPRYPLREYEFVELFVRCAVRSHLHLNMAHPSRESIFSPVDVVDDNGRMATTNTLGSTQVTTFVTFTSPDACQHLTFIGHGQHVEQDENWHR